MNQCLLYSGVRWLSRGDNLQRVVDLTVKFNVDVDPSPCAKLKCLRTICSIWQTVVGTLPILL